MYAKHPKVAEKFEAHTPKGKKLPKHVKPKGKYSSATNTYR